MNSQLDFFFHFKQSRNAQRMVPHLIKLDLPSLINIVKVIPHRDAQRPLFQVTLHSISLPINANHYGRHIRGRVCMV